MSSPSIQDMPLPYGWIKQWDQDNRQYFYVDTRASPPRSIWAHPYKDAQYLAAHPEIREKNQNTSNAYLALNPSPPPLERRHSYGGRPASPYAGHMPGSAPGHKRRFFEKLKDKMYSSEQVGAGTAPTSQGYTGPSSQYGTHTPPQYVYTQSAGYHARRMGGAGLPLLGGLAGGLLLGDMLGDIDHHDGGGNEFDSQYFGGFDGGDSFGGNSFF